MCTYEIYLEENEDTDDEGDQQGDGAGSVAELLALAVALGVAVLDGHAAGRRDHVVLHAVVVDSDHVHIRAGLRRLVCP